MLPYADVVMGHISTLIEEDPLHVVVEVFLIAMVFFLLFQKQYRVKNRDDKLTEKEVEQLCQEWEPEPLAPAISNVQAATPTHVVSSGAGRTCVVDGAEKLNFGTMNFLGLQNDERVNEACRKTLRKYGVGSCGPRGFYGTVDVHLELEDNLSSFMGTEKAIAFSYGLATATSVIPAFLKRGDLIICDESCNFAIQQGCSLSRSTVKYFKHNDMEDLERLLREQVERDAASGNSLNRRFIITEGLYLNVGDICPLPQLVELKDKYRFRLLVDETVSFGTLGKYGRGVTEHFGIDITRVEIITGSLEHSLASIGGFCVGDRIVVDHQRLSASGYCFSASQPPYTAVAASVSIDILRDDDGPHGGRAKLERVRANARTMRAALAKLPGLRLRGSFDESPIFHLELETPSGSDDDDYILLQRVAEAALQSGVAVIAVRYSHLQLRRQPPSLRVTVSAAHTDDDIAKAAAALKKACKALK